MEYLRNILNHLNQVDANEQMRKVISDFRPKYEDFANEVAYSQPYFELLQRAQDHLPLDTDQRRVIEIAIRDYTLRGIALSEDKQSQLKEFNKAISAVAEHFQNNVVDEQAAFSFFFPNDASLQEMPADLLEKMKNLTADGQGYTLNADPTLL